MKILHLYKTFLGDNFGGVEQVIGQIACNQKSKFKHRVVSLSPNPQPKVLDFGGCENIRFQESFNLASNGISLSLFREFSTLTKDCDLIHYHFPWPFADLMHLFFNLKKPTVITYHSDIIRQKKLLFFYRPIMNRFLNSVDKIVATSPNYFATSSVLQKFHNKVAIIPIGLDKESYLQPSPERLQYWRQRFGDQFFLFVGVLRYYKGLPILLKSAKGSPFSILIGGTGPEEEQLKAMAEELQLDNVHFLGKLAEEDKIALLHLALALVFPSHLRSEAFGVSLLEGAMYSKPLISAEIGTGTSYINIDEETGLVVPPNDPLALRKAMQTLWDNPQKRKQMGEGAAARFDALFSAEKMVRQYDALYSSIA